MKPFHGDRLGGAAHPRNRPHGVRNQRTWPTHSRHQSSVPRLYAWRTGCGGTSLAHARVDGLTARPCVLCAVGQVYFVLLSSPLRPRRRRVRCPILRGVPPSSISVVISSRNWMSCASAHRPRGALGTGTAPLARPRTLSSSDRSKDHMRPAQFSASASSPRSPRVPQRALG
jgi:hypothetical protein